MESDWSNLPVDLLVAISDGLGTLIDHVRFRAVCRSWANTPPPSRYSSQMPWLLLPYKVNSVTRTFLSVSDNKFYRVKSPEFRGRDCHSSSHGWLVLVNETPEVVLYNPLTCEKILLSQLTELPDAQRFRENRHDGSNPNWDVDFMQNFTIHRLILSGNPALGHQDCWAALWYNKMESKLAFCRLGDTSWTEIVEDVSSDDDFDDHDYVDIIFHKGLLYALNSTGSVLICDLGSPHQLTEVHPEGLDDDDDDERSIHLTEMGSSLLLIRVSPMEGHQEQEGGRQDRRVQYRNQLNSFSIFELDTEKWIKLSNLGGYTMFSDSKCCISKLASPGCRQNCIYFLRNFELEVNDYKEKHSVWAKEREKGYELSSYDLEDSTIHPMASFILHLDARRCKSVKGVWYTPDLASSWKTSCSSGTSAAADPRLWMPTGKGISSVKLDPSLDFHGRYSSPGPIKPEIWSKLREANFPAKLLMVLWRVACGVVPYKLFGRKSPLGIFPDSCCPIFHQEEESLEHLLLFCRFSRVAWLNSEWPMRHLASQDIEISSWVNSILDAGPSFRLHATEAIEFLCIAAVFIRHIWDIRNYAATGKPIPHPVMFASWLGKIYRDMNPTDWLHKSEWFPPYGDETKVNFNAAICRDFTMLGMTYRDDGGRFLLEWTEKIPKCEATVAEAKAALLAISIAIKSGFTKLVLEGTCPFVINPLKHSSIPPYHGIAGLIGDIKALLASLELWSVERANAKQNMAAHNLACWAAFYDRTGSIPVASLPPCVVYADDMYRYRDPDSARKEPVVSLHPATANVPPMPLPLVRRHSNSQVYYQFS